MTTAEQRHTSADPLRAAAKVLRARAEATEGDPWHAGRDLFDGTPVWSHGGCGVADAMDMDHARYIATMHPGVALALAGLLDQLADEWVSGNVESQMNDLADLILGGDA